MPLLCQSCLQYIQRTTAESITCTGCDAIFHKNCVDFDANTPVLEWKCSDYSSGFDLCVMQLTLAQIKVDIDRLKKCNDETSKMVQNITSKLDVVSELSKQVYINKNNLVNLNRVMDDVNVKCSSLESILKRNNMVISGVPPSSAINLTELVVNIANLLQVPMSSDNIDSAFRFRSMQE